MRWTPFLPTSTWVGILFLSMLLACDDVQEQPPPIPAVELRGMEPEVAKRITEARHQLSAEPQSSRRWGSYAMVLHAHRQVREAQECYRVAARLDPQEPRWPALLGRLLETEGNEEAMAQIARSVELAPELAPLRITLANALLRWNRIQEAKPHFDAARKQHGDTESHALLGLAQIAQLEMRGEESVALLEQARTLAPDHGEVHALLATLYARQGKLVEAQAEAAKARALPSRKDYRDPYLEEALSHCASIASLVTSARILLDQGSVSEGIRLYEEAVRLDPNQFDVQASLGLALAKANRLPEAEQHLIKALELRPSDVLTLVNLVRLYHASGESAKAVEALRRAIQAKPDDPKALELLAGLPHLLFQKLMLDLQQEQQYSAVITACRELLRIDPVHSDASEALAFVLAFAPESTGEELAESIRIAQEMRVSAIRKARLLYAEAVAEDRLERRAEADASAARALTIARKEGLSELIQSLEKFLSRRPSPEQGR